jgi:cytochrome c peroxidase
MKNVFLILSTAFFFISCSVDPEVKPLIPVDDVKEIIPEGWPAPYYNFSANPITADGFILGRTLFYDPILSADNTISCGSCHQQFVAFAHAGHTVSHGINGLLGTRNAPAIQNMNWNPYYMHDGGVLNLELQPAAPITNPVEMNESLSNVVNKLSNSGKYNQLFTKAYGDADVNTQRIFKALAQFMGTLYSYNSKYDEVKKGQASFTSNEENGYNLFLQKCASCHKEPLFSDYQFRNNGLAINPLINDSGRAHITADPNDRYKFKTPSLRNIEKTSPYMHDGSLQTLEQCLDHYTSGIVNLTNLDPALSGGISLTLQEKSDIVSFLKTLTDTKFLTDKRYAEQ